MPVVDVRTAPAHALGGFSPLRDRVRVPRPDAVTAPAGFLEASEQVLDMLVALAPMGAWVVTRVERGTWTVLASKDSCYGVAPGLQLPWADTLCSRMIGGAPRVAGDLATEPAYAEVPVTDQLQIGAYVGTEIVTGTGDLFGTLCAVDPQRQSLDAEALETVITTVAALLSRVLSVELALTEARQGYERAATEAEQDHQTGLLNRRGWDAHVHRLSNVAEALHLGVGAIVVDLDDLKAVNDGRGHAAGDALIIDAAALLASSCRSQDSVARLGGDEFGVMLPDIDATAALAIAGRIRDSFAAHGLAASVGVAHGSGDQVRRTVREADDAMFAEKALHHAQVALRPA